MTRPWKDIAEKYFIGYSIEKMDNSEIKKMAQKSLNHNMDEHDTEASVVLIYLY